MTQNDGMRISVQRSHLKRDLGIMIDSKLNFSERIHMVSKKSKWNHGSHQKNFYMS